MIKNLEQFVLRLEELDRSLMDPSVMRDSNKIRDIGKERSTLEPIVRLWQEIKTKEEELADVREMLTDPEMKEMVQEEMAALQKKIPELKDQLRVALIPPDPYEGVDIILEIRAGTGGDEAALFAYDLFRMYSRYAETQRWKVEVISENSGDHGGYKEIIVRIVGQGVYSKLKFESGAHRVQRVPDTESQGRIHTSACTVAVMAEADEQDAIEINKGDLRVDTFRASGSGGQHVNKTDSAIRLTHLPTGLVVECQDERSQHKNRAKAMSVLQARLNAAQDEAAAKEQSDQRKNLVGSGDRSERIRTYNFPQGRVTDHRINLTLYKLGEVMEGSLDEVIQPLVSEFQAEQLASLSDG